MENKLDKNESLEQQLVYIQGFSKNSPKEQEGYVNSLDSYYFLF
jgi:hypothetical protein